MLTLIDAISLAGDRQKQNDDAAGAAGKCAWVIDGATDLHDAPLMGSASDAAWIAHGLNQRLAAFLEGSDDAEVRLRGALEQASRSLSDAFSLRVDTPAPARWMIPLCSVLIAAESADGIVGLDLGDCRLFARDATGGHAAGGHDDAADRETQFATQAAKIAGPTGALYRAPNVLEVLREKRAEQLSDPRSAIFSLDPRFVESARFWRLPLARPAHLLLCTDGFSALSERYGAYDSAGFLDAALKLGLADLGRELRDIETADSGGERHPRWKRSDDATALLLRLS